MEEIKLTLNNFKKQMNESQMIIIGMGGELSADKVIPRDDKRVLEFFEQSKFHKYKEVLSKAQSDETKAYMTDIYYKYFLLQAPPIKIYEDLAKLLKGKDYFIVTSNTDGLIYRGSLDPKRIVAPCGDIGNMQCKTPCCQSLHVALPLLQSKIEEYEAYEDESLIGCGSCKEDLIFNERTAKTKKSYIEHGYLPQWAAYTKWLQGTLNKEFFVLELGEGFENPGLFRWPFEKIVYFNQKAHMVRVHQSFYQINEEIKGKAVGIQMNAVDFLNI